MRQSRRRGDNPRNFHAHLLLTLRQASPLGLRRVKTREWNSDSMLLKWRESWAKRQNEALRVRGHAARVDHHSLPAQSVAALARGDRIRAVALDRVPEVHVGPKVKKAVRESPPVSKDRAAGPVPRRPANQKNRRTVFYTHIDHGSRAQFNVARGRLNARRFGSAAAKAQKHIARLRERQVCYVARFVEIGNRCCRVSPEGSRTRKLGLLREVGEANKINKLSNRLGKSGVIGLQGFSRRSPKQRCARQSLPTTIITDVNCLGARAFEGQLGPQERTRV